MKICFPVEKDEGLASVVSGHFGSAPVFMLVDTDSSATEAIPNIDRHHSHGACNPLKALTGRNIDGIVVGNIGAGALKRIAGSGLKVFRAQGATVRENTELIASNKLGELQDVDCCPGHGDGSVHGQHGHGKGCCH
jgi:predicted Fe-Mo cluster-binding NifX family protein